MNDKPRQAHSALFGLKFRDIPLVDEPAEADFGSMDSADFDIPILTDIAPDPESANEREAAEDTRGTEPPDSAAAATGIEPESPIAAVRQPSLFEEFAAPGSPEAENLDRIIDELVFEYLPRLEHELRIRLYDHLIALGPKTRDPGSNR